MDNPGEILRLCRLCLVKDQVNIPIFEEQGDIRQIFLKISSCLPVTVSRDDQLPKKICDGCSNKLDLLYEFWNTSANAEKTLLSWLGQAGVKDADETISAVAQQIKPAETQVKEEALEDGHAISQDNFGLQSFDEDTKDEAEPPPRKRARRTAAVKAQISIAPESDDDDDDMDNTEAMTKVEGESEESDGEDRDPSYGEVPGTSADDQAGPSGVGKDGVEAPLKMESEIYMCTVCSLVFTTPEKLYDHLKNIEIRTLCKCQDCESFFGPDDQCNHPETSKIYHCALCKIKLHHKDLEFHVCFHLNHGSRKIKVEKMPNYSKEPEGTDVPTNKIPRAYHRLSPQTCYVKAKYKLTKARDRYFQQLKRINAGFYKQTVWVDSDDESIQEAIFENSDAVFTPIADEETIPCLFCFAEVPPLMLSKHLNRFCIPLDKDLQVTKNPSKIDKDLCYICGKIIAPKSLKSHVANYHVHKSNVCEICGLTVTRLNAHRVTHFEERQFSCKECSKSFKRRQDLCKHRHVHAVEGKHKCPTCEKRFKFSYNLNVHMRTHMNKKPFECSHCGKTFTTKQWRNNHLKTHS